MAATEESVARDIAERFGGTSHSEAGEGAAVPAGRDDYEVETFDFDGPFQSKIAALALRDPGFLERTDGLIRPEYFENVAEAALVNIGLRYFGKYKRVPDLVTLMNLVKQDVRAKVIRPDMLGEVKQAIKAIASADVGDRDYVVDQVATFARHQAVSAAILESVGLLERGGADKILEVMKKAAEVGAVEAGAGSYNYASRVKQRTEVRRAEAAGEIAPRGIPTGVRILDKLLKHKGWGRKELTLFMGGPKIGKSTALAMFGKTAWMAGYNVLFVTLEVSTEILSDRLDASIAEIAVNALGDHILEVEDKIRMASEKAGELIIEEFPSGTMTPAMLRRVLARHKARGIKFDVVVVDYADLMAPDIRYDDPRENSKGIYTSLRAIAQEEDLAMLTATQTNREGAKSAVAGMEHVAEDFNKIRIADLVISINRTPDEKARNEARLFLAASRNQKGDITIRVQQDLETMTFIKKVLGVE